MSDVIAELRQAMVEFDSTFWRSDKAKHAARVLTLVRELLSEVDAERRPEGASVSRTPEVDGVAAWRSHIDVRDMEPLGPPNPASSVFPDDANEWWDGDRPTTAGAELPE